MYSVGFFSGGFGARRVIGQAAQLVDQLLTCLLVLEQVGQGGIGRWLFSILLLLGLRWHRECHQSQQQPTQYQGKGSLRVHAVTSVSWRVGLEYQNGSVSA